MNTAIAVDVIADNTIAENAIAVDVTAILYSNMSNVTRVLYKDLVTFLLH